MQTQTIKLSEYGKGLKVGDMIERSDLKILYIKEMPHPKPLIKARQ